MSALLGIYTQDEHEHELRLRNVLLQRVGDLRTAFDIRVSHVLAMRRLCRISIVLVLGELLLAGVLRDGWSVLLFGVGLAIAIHTVARFNRANLEAQRAHHAMELALDRLHRCNERLRLS